MLRLLVLAAALSAHVIGIASPGEADMADGVIETDASANDSSISVYVLTLQQGSPPLTYETGDSGATWSCNYAENVPTTEDPNHDPSVPYQPQPGQHVALFCWTPDDQIGGMWWVVYDPANPFGPIAAAQRARDLARDQLDLPTPRIGLSPPPPAPHLPGLESWFYLTNPFEALRASATLGSVTSTVTATPTEVIWDPADGSEPFTCQGPGQPYTPDLETAPCGHTYHRSGSYNLTATILWDTTWESTTGEGGPLQDLTTTATVELRVRQAQAVIN